MSTLNSSLFGEYSRKACGNSLWSQMNVRHSGNLSLPVNRTSHICTENIKRFPNWQPEHDWGYNISYHLLGKCCAYMVSRYSIIGAHTMEPEKLGKVRPTTLLWFVRATKRFSWPLVILGSRIGPNIIGQPPAPKVKVRQYNYKEDIMTIIHFTYFTNNAIHSTLEILQLLRLTFVIPGYSYMNINTCLLVLTFSKCREMHTIAIAMLSVRPSVCVSHWSFTPRWCSISQNVVDHTLHYIVLWRST